MEGEGADKGKLQQRGNMIELRIFRLGTERFAIFADEISEVTAWRQPTPLPGSPQTILGVLAVQARMITVLDTAKLLGMSHSAQLVSPGHVIVLSGQEQLGLTATTEETPRAISRSDIEVDSDKEGRPLLGYLRQDEEIQILDPLQLFVAAIRGKERRRRLL